MSRTLRKRAVARRLPLGDEFIFVAALARVATPTPLHRFSASRDAVVEHGARAPPRPAPRGGEAAHRARHASRTRPRPPKPRRPPATAPAEAAPAEARAPAAEATAVLAPVSASTGGGGNGLRLDTALRVLRRPGDQEVRRRPSCRSCRSRYKVLKGFAPFVRLGVVQTPRRPAPGGRAASSTRCSARPTRSSLRPSCASPSSSVSRYRSARVAATIRTPTKSRASRRHLRTLGDGQRDVRGERLHRLPRRRSSRSFRRRFHGASRGDAVAAHPRARRDGSDPTLRAPTSRPVCTSATSSFPQLSLRRWSCGISAGSRRPKQIAADKTDSLRDTTTLAVGPRVHIQVVEGQVAASQARAASCRSTIR